MLDRTQQRLRLIAELEAQLSHRAPNTPLNLILVDVDGYWDLGDQREQVVSTLTDALRQGLPGTEPIQVGNDAHAAVVVDVEPEVLLLKLDRIRLDFLARTQASFSGGIAVCPRDASEANELIAVVGEAMHKAKKQGKNQIAFAPMEKMRLKTSHYRVGQLEKLAQLAQRTGRSEAVLLREALSDLLLKHKME